MPSELVSIHVTKRGASIPPARRYMVLITASSQVSAAQQTSGVAAPRRVVAGAITGIIRVSIAPLLRASFAVAQRLSLPFRHLSGHTVPREYRSRYNHTLRAALA